ncbi:MAG: AAA family ATPase [Fimbriimonas sp.]
MVSRRLAELHPDMEVLECYDTFDIDGFLRYGNGDARLIGRLFAEEQVDWDAEARTLDRRFRVCWIEVEWSGARYQVLRLPYGMCGEVHFVVGSAVPDFVQTVLAYTGRRSPVTHVYSGWWSESEAMDRAIQQSNWADLVLPDGVMRTLEMHTSGFFESRDEFDALAVPWKRGILFTGPPGNGKSHLIRAILNRLSVPRLIVKSFGDDADDVQEVFDKVRELSPCVLVLEDLDSLIKKELLSVVLNSLDGTEPLNGVLVLATTNHPEKLDPAIRNRPSRFDRVIEFGPPSLELREDLLIKLMARGPEEMRLTSAERYALAQSTDGFSYAYLKELAISSALVWARDKVPGSMFGIAQELVTELRAQLKEASLAS